MIKLKRLDIINEMVVVALPIQMEEPCEYQYQIRWIGGPVYYKRKKGDVTWEFTTESDFAQNVKSSNLIDWMKVDNDMIHPVARNK